MKKSLFISLVTLSLSSCNSLVEEPESFLTTSQFYKTDQDAIAAVTAVYNALNENQHTLYNRLIQISTEMATDDYEAGPRARNAHVRAISNLTHDPSNDRMQELWRQSYDGINRANIAIEKIQSSQYVSRELGQRLVNEAKFIRALLYFNLVRWFGEVPLVLEETVSLSKESIYVSQATEDEVYAQIIADLTDAEQLPAALSEQELGRATSGAAKSLLSKVYLTKKEWRTALQKSKEVIDDGNYDLFENFEDVFNVATKNGKEHIFSAQFKGLSNFFGNMLGGSSAPYEVPGINGDYADALNKKSGLFESFSDNDKRKKVTFLTEMVSPVDGRLYTFDPHLHKYFDPAAGGTQYQSSKNTPIIRFAEVLLIYAEALNEVSESPTAEAYAAIDRVRARAGIAKLADVAPDLTTEAFRDSVFQERRKELVFEYQRWFDLARRGPEYFVATLKAAGKPAALPKHVHFPIPQRELDLNPKLKQVPGW